MKKLCAVLALMSALGVGPGTARASPAKRWPVFDGARLQQIVDTFAAKGVTVCPAQVRSPQDITGSSANQTIDLYASSRWPSCPQHRSAADPKYNPAEERATYESEAFLDVGFYSTPKAFDRGVKTWKRQLLHWPIVSWSWKPVVVGLNAGYPDVVNAVLKAMKALPGKPTVLFDNS